MISAWALSRQGRARVTVRPLQAPNVQHLSETASLAVAGSRAFLHVENASRSAWLRCSRGRAQVRAHGLGGHAAGCKDEWNFMLKHSVLLHAQAARRARRRMKWARASNKLLRASAGCSASSIALTMMSRQCGLPATSESSSTAFRRSRRARWGHVALHAHAMQQPCHAGAQLKCCDVVLMHRTCVPSCLLRRSRARARMQRWPCAGQTCSRSRFHR